MFFSFTTVFLLTFISLVTGRVQESDVTFYLFTSGNRETAIEITKENATADTNSSFVFIIHGWMENRDKPWYSDLTNAFLSRFNDINVIQVDWSKPAAQFYPTSAHDTKETGDIIAEFILRLVQDRIATIENVHVVGHSLGGHIAGFVGKHLQMYGLKLPRITALDAAGPLFQGLWASEASKLSKTDADVVVAIHTDPWKLGYLFSFGSVDIYANGRPLIQPGCPDSAGNSFLICSHQRSHQFYIDALQNSGTLVATRCWSYVALVFGWCKENTQVDLGGDIRSDDRGTYYLTTLPKKPYGLGP